MPNPNTILHHNIIKSYSILHFFGWSNLSIEFSKKKNYGWFLVQFLIFGTKIFFLEYALNWVFFTKTTI
jgi:hypothetical protein